VAPPANATTAPTTPATAPPGAPAAAAPQPSSPAGEGDRKDPLSPEGQKATLEKRAAPPAADKGAPSDSPQTATATGAAPLPPETAKAAEAERKKHEEQQKAEASQPQTQPADKQQQARDDNAEIQAALDPNKPSTESDQKKLEEKAKPKKPADALRERGVPEDAIEILANSSSYDAQRTAAVGDPDIKDQGQLEAGKSGRPLELTDEQRAKAVSAQAELSKDMQVGADVRKAVDGNKAANMLGGNVDPGMNPAMAGDFATKAGTAGNTPTQAVATLGLDYKGSNFVKTNPDGTKDFADEVKDHGVFVIDTKMTPEMLEKAAVPLGHDMMKEAEKQSKALSEAGVAEEDKPPMLQQKVKKDKDGKPEIDEDGNVVKEMAHATERNRSAADDPRTGMGTSQLMDSSLADKADKGDEVDKGSGVSKVNQEMTIDWKKGPAPLPASAPGADPSTSPTQLNLIQPGGKVVTCANLVPVLDENGKPLPAHDKDGKELKDEKGNPVPQTRYQLAEIKEEKVKQYVYDKADKADASARVAYAERLAAYDKARKEGQPGVWPGDPPPPNPELEKWRAEPKNPADKAAA
jgi:hypothetical protein